MDILSRPKAVVIENNCKQNISRMVDKASKLGAEFRPHFKTHQSIEIGRWFRNNSITGITASTPEMASYFIDDGWDDITIGFPFYPGQIDVLNDLSKQCHFRLFVHREKDAELLGERIDYPVSIMIEINAGYDRSGLRPEHSDRIRLIVEASRKFKNVSFHGFYIHDGDTYNVHGKNQVENVLTRNFKAFEQLKKSYPDARLCIGDTPSSSLLDDQLSMADELSPGNLIFYDLMQINIGSCGYNDIGLLVQAPVAQEKNESDECIIHGGAVHFSKDRIEMDGATTFGQPVTVDQQGTITKIEGSSLVALSQEHGTVTGLTALKKAYGTNELSDIWICPVHSCLTANLFGEYFTLSGKKIEKRILS